MKKVIYLFTLILFCFNNITNAQTSIASGNWTSPTTWGGVPPMPGSTVIINHTVTLDIDYGYSSGSIIINASGALNGNSVSRALAISGGTLTVNGTLNIARAALFSGTITNSGTFQNDSLLNATTLTNNSGATINAAQFLVNTGGTFNNNGSVVSTNFMNISTVTSSGAFTANNLTNSKSFTNSASGLIIAHNFLNSDTLASPAVFTNNGGVTVNHDWRNTDQINGSGKFCIQNNTTNSGAMSGTFDFCDQTGGNIDSNTGTIVGTITYCLFSCTTGMKENLNGSIINVYPNPNNGVFSISFGKKVSENVELELFTILGERISSMQIDSDKTNIDLSKQAKGIYFYQIKKEKRILNTGKIIIE